jgi:chemotaxis signal transduction protein
VVGAMLWRNLTTPLISLGRLIFRVPPEADLNSRIIIVNTWAPIPSCPISAFWAPPRPRPLNLQRGDIKAGSQSEELTCTGRVLSWARYQDQPVIIPDMDAIEAVLQPLVRRA